MYRSIAAAGALLGLIVTLSSAQADERWPRWYVGVNGGLAMHQDADLSTGGSFSFDDGLSLSGVVGYMPHWGGMSFMDMLRFEGEIAHVANDVDAFSGFATTGEMESLAYMFNTYIDFNNSTSFTPYLGAGIGMADVEMTTAGGLSVDDRVLAYQFRGGVGFAPASMPMTEVSLGYRYFATTEPNYSFGDVENDVHNVEVGMKLRF